MHATPILAISNRLRSTPFTSRVLQMGASAFTVYNHMLLPTEFESVEADYWHLCEHVQVWDVGVERQVSIQGPDAQKLVQWMTPRDISAVPAGRCVYVPLADENGLLINDPIALKLAQDHWWLSIADSDVLLWAKGLATGAQLDVQVIEPDVWPLAVQGPKAEALMCEVFDESIKDIKFFRFESRHFHGHNFVVARSGWSKQGGFEIYVDNAKVGVELYDALFEKGAAFNVRPGCPNLIERIEGGLLSYGNDMTNAHTPLEASMGGFFTLDENVKAMSVPALMEQHQQGLERQLLGLILDDPEAQATLAENPFDNKGDAEQSRAVGRIGSQAWSPRYKALLATAMLEAPYLKQQAIDVTLTTGATFKAKVVALPFDFASEGMTQHLPST